MKTIKWLAVATLCFTMVFSECSSIFHVKAENNSGSISQAYTKHKETQNVLSSRKPQEGYKSSTNIVKPKKAKALTTISTEKTYTINSSIHASVDEGVLTISGLGELPDYDQVAAPWSEDVYSIKQIIINEGITSIGKQAFYGLSYLESVTMPNSLTAIKEAAFFQCYKLKMVIGGNTLHSIGQAAFAECAALKDFPFINGLETIEKYAFQDTALENVTLPASVKSCDNYAFMRSVKAFEVAPGNPFFSSKDGVLFNKDQSELIMFPVQQEITSYSIPSTVTLISEAAFIDASKLETIVLPLSVKEIKDWAFSRAGITSLTLPATITSLGYGIADGCDNLTNVVINANLDSLSYRSFANCTNLTSVVCNGKIATLDARSFYNCTSLSTVVLPKALRSIYVYAFYNCKNLKTVEFPSSIEYIEAKAFELCTQLTTKMPDNLTAMEDGSYQAIETIPINGTQKYEETKKVLDIVNQERAKVGKAPLIMDKELFQAAALRAAETAVFFDHTRPSGSNCATVSSRLFGENIAAGSVTAESVMHQWMNSSGHKANILREDYVSIGIGCFQHNGITYWVQIFGIDKGEEVIDYPADITTAYNIAAKKGSFSYRLSCIKL